MKGGRAAICTALLALVTGVAAGAEEAEEPDLELFEYLGSWQEGDEEWLVVDAWRQRAPERRRPEERRRRNDDEQSE